MLAQTSGQPRGCTDAAQPAQAANAPAPCDGGDPWRHPRGPLHPRPAGAVRYKSVAACARTTAMGEIASANSRAMMRGRHTNQVVAGHGG
eukprot:4856681-Alexandrium_andersonii.AAC.1